MAEWLKVIILGVVEGITEFLPISSTGHLIVGADMLQFDMADGTFEIFIQIGAVIAVLVYYWGDLWQQARTFFGQETLPEKAAMSRASVQQLWLGVIVAFIPAAVIGLALGDLIDDVLFHPLVVAVALIVGGLMFIVIERYLPQTERAGSIDEAPLTMRQALIVGFWQVLALIPGMSRSGMSIIGGMVAKLDRQRATQFSFYLAMPTLGAATIYTLLKDLDSISGSDFTMLILGAVVSGIVAWASIGWLLRYVAGNSFIPFGYYRIIAGIIIILWWWQV